VVGELLLNEHQLAEMSLDEWMQLGAVKYAVGRGHAGDLSSTQRDPHHLMGEPSQSSNVAANAVVGEVAPHQ
jgi:hypothetical protein